MQVAAFAHLTGDLERLEWCRQRYKTVLLPDQMAADGSLSYLLGENTAGAETHNFENALRSRFAEAAVLLQNGRLRDAALLIKGLGRGLTPQGDDFIAGLLFALHLRESLSGEPVKQVIEDIHAGASSKNPFSRAMLDCAAQGKAFEQLKNLVASLFAVDPGMIAARTRELTAIGATSGADIATGLILGSDTINREDAMDAKILHMKSSVSPCLCGKERH